MIKIKGSPISVTMIRIQKISCIKLPTKFPNLKSFGAVANVIIHLSQSFLNTL